MPQRFLKPGILTSLRLARCSPWAQLLYYKLLSLVDDYSRFDAHPLLVGRAAFPYGDHRGRLFKDEAVQALLGELENARLNESDDPCLARYMVAGTEYLLLHRWTERLKFQNGKYPGSRYPSPEQDVQLWQKLSKDVQTRQRLSSPSSSSTPTKTTVPYGEEGLESNGAIESRTQYAALRDQVTRLEAVAREGRTVEQREDLKKKRAELEALQKKQAAGEF